MLSATRVGIARTAVQARPPSCHLSAPVPAVVATGVPKALKAPRLPLPLVPCPLALGRHSLGAPLPLLAPPQLGHPQVLGPGPSLLRVPAPPLRAFPAPPLGRGQQTLGGCEGQKRGWRLILGLIYVDNPFAMGPGARPSACAPYLLILVPNRDRAHAKLQGLVQVGLLELHPVILQNLAVPRGAKLGRQGCRGRRCVWELGMPLVAQSQGLQRTKPTVGPR